MKYQVKSQHNLGADFCDVLLTVQQSHSYFIYTDKEWFSICFKFLSKA